MEGRKRREKRESGARQLNVWLNPKYWDILARYQARKRLPSQAAALRMMMDQMGKWLDRQEQEEDERDRRGLGLVPEEEDEPPELRAAREVSQGDSG